MSLINNRWDFAGQSVYYNSHQFFLSPRAVYILVWLVVSLSIYISNCKMCNFKFAVHY